MSEKPQIKIAHNNSPRFRIPTPVKIALLIFAVLLSSGSKAVRAQTPNCPDASTTNFVFSPQAVGDSLTQNINLAPCETIEIHESHDMNGDNNRGTNVKVSYLNADGQELYNQLIWGFDTATDNTFSARGSYAEPFPWVGVRAPVTLPATLKVESTFALGFGSPPQQPRYYFTIIRKPRPGYNVGGYNFDNAPLVGSFPATYRGSVRDGYTATPLDPGQYFKVHLEAGQSMYASGSAFEETYYGANFTMDVYNASHQLVTTTGWVNTTEWRDHPANFTSGAFTNTGGSAADFYVRVWSRNWAVEYFTFTLSVTSTVTREEPLIFLPGIMGSILVDQATHTELWPGVGQNHNALSLNPDDHPSQTITATDVIRRYSIASIPYYGSVYNYVVYGPLLEMLANRGGYREYQVNNDDSRRTNAGCDTSQRSNDPTLFVFAYDWRKSSAENAQKLQEYVRCVQKFHPGVKVNLLAHSMGGLVARRYILDNPGKVNKLITIASPWLGAPKSAYTLETGEAGLSGLLVRKNTLKRVSEFSKGVHELLPSRSYFDLGGLPFKEDGDYNRNGVPNETYNYVQLMNTLNARHDSRSTPGTNNQTFHEYMGAAQDDWRNDQSGIKYDHIIGEKQAQDTIGQIVGFSYPVCALGRCYYYESYKLNMINGDGTVPKRSATRIGNNLNLTAPNTDRWYFSHPNTLQPDEMYEHTGLTQNVIVHNTVLYALGKGPHPGGTQIEDGTGPPADESTPPPPPTASNTSYYMKATGVDFVSVTDAAGNSNLPIDDLFTLPVPGIKYHPLGDKSVLVSAPVSQTYTYSFQSDGNPVAIELVKGVGNRVPLEAVRYQDVQIPAGVKASIQTTGMGVSDLRYDADGDGVYETVVQPTASLTGAAAQDVLPPTLTLTATQQSTGVVVSIAAQDGESGVKSVLYSLDGENFQPYTQPLVVNPAQTPKVYAFADDFAANRSDLETLKVPNRRALLVVGSTPPGEGDRTLKTHLEDMGFAVTVKDALSSASTDADGQNLVVISSTVVPDDVNTKFRDISIPVLTWKGELLDDLGMTGGVAGTDFATVASQTNVSVSDPPHPLAAGLSGTIAVAGLPTAFGWAVPNASAHKVVTLSGDAAKATVFGYDAGASMPGQTAPARRAALFLTDDAIAKLNSNGWALFNASVLWTAGVTNNAPTVSITQPSENQFFNPGSNVVVNALAADADGRVVKVDFYAGTLLVGTSTTSPYGVTWNNAPVGEHLLTVVATDDGGATTTSAAIHISINVSSGAVAGHVTQPNGTTAIGGASLKLYSGSTLVYSATTDNAGSYRIEGLDPNTYTLVCSAEGYDPQTQSVAIANGATTTQDFQLAFALPAIESLSPSTGSPGTTVTITGSHFFASPSDNQVKFNGVVAAVSSASSTSLTTTVPASATSGRLTVTTPSGTSASVIDFFVPPSPYTGADIGTTGRMSTGETKTVTVSTSGKVGLITFEGMANRRISLKITGVSLTGGNGYTDLSIKKPDGMNLASQSYISTSGTFIDAQTLPTSGGYTILVDPQGTNTGSVTLSLYDVPADSTGTISPDGQAVTVTTTTPGQNSLLSFNGTQNQRVSLKISGVTLTGGNGYTDIFIRKPDGSTLVSQGYVSGSDFIDVQTLPTSGIYTILVNNQTSNVGSATLRLYDVPADASASITPGGAPMTLTTTVPGQNAQATFTGSTGQRVSLKISGVTLTGGNGYTDIFIRKPDGSNLASQGYVSGSDFIDVQSLPVSGTYKVYVNPQTSNVGSVTLTLCDVPADATANITPGGAPVTLTTTVAGQNGIASFNGTQGQRVSLKITGVGLTGGNGYADLSIRKPDGSTLVSTSYVSSSGFIDVQTLTATGTYTILFNPQGSNVGNATLTLYDVPADQTGTLTVDASPSGLSFTIPGQNAALTFGGFSGQQITVRLTNNTMAPITVRLLKPDGSTLTSYTTYGESSFNLTMQTLPVTGTYTVSIDPSGASTGGISVRVTNGSVGWLERVFDYCFSLVA